MYRRLTLTLALCCLSLSVLTLIFFASAVMLRVNESAIRITLNEKQTTVSLAVENLSGHNLTARVSIEWLDAQSRAQSRTETLATIQPGSSAISLDTSLLSAENSLLQQNDLLWYRLRYAIRPETTSTSQAEAQFNPVEGLVALSEVMPELFELRIAAPEYAQLGTRYRMHIRAAHPTTDRPIKGVQVESEITVDEMPNFSRKATGTTDEQGYVKLDFDLPREINHDGAQVKVHAHFGQLERGTKSEIRLLNNASILVSTDKPLYQPGQMLRVRTLVFDAARRAVAEAEGILKIFDPEGTTVFRTTLKTSRFGVANAEWPIPESMRLGQYSIQMVLGDETYSSARGGQQIKISRYELPNFTVEAKPDHAYYLPGQSAEVAVRADYLFGQPVTRGHVRVVQETERKWNYREQKWETEEEESYEGETDAQGRFLTRIDLTKAHEALAENAYLSFRDLHYAAYFTDPTTNRTEERRFDLRVTRAPIHVYVIEERQGNPQDGPLEFYLSTFYADGAPAECEVRINALSAENPRFNFSAATTLQPPLRTVRTNRYGVAKVSNLTVPNRNTRNVELGFLARDAQGRTGYRAESLWCSSSSIIRVATDKTIYRPGEPIKVKITSSEPERLVIVEAVRAGKVIHSEMLSVHQGQAEITVPYRPEFQDEIVIGAFDGVAMSEDDRTFRSRTVLFPRPHELKLDVRMAQTTYRPGEEARADFRLTTTDGHGVLGALGVNVFDKAVEERARANQEFQAIDGFFGALRAWIGETESIANLSRRDLNRLDLTQPISEDVTLVAEILLRNSWYSPSIFSSDKSETNPCRAFASFLATQFQPTKEALEQQYKAKMIYPKDAEALRRQLLVAGISFDRLRDPWGMPYRANFLARGANDELQIMSAGADKRFETDDDFTAQSFSWPYFRFHGEAINRAVEQYHARTGSFIRDAIALASELRREGLDFDSLRDPWGQAYRAEFRVEKRRLIVTIKSSGPNKVFEPETTSVKDDFTIWSTEIDYFAETQARLNAALDEYFTAEGRLPQNETELREALQRAGMDWETPRDPWGRHYYVNFKVRSQFADRVTIQSYAQHGQKPQSRTEITPVTQQLHFIYLNSAGADGQENTNDDFEVASFSRITAEQDSRQPTPQTRPSSPPLTGAMGGMSGDILDPTGAVIAGVSIKAINLAMATVYETKSDASGSFWLKNLPAGTYRMEINAVGFKQAIITGVEVRATEITDVKVTLEVGAATEAVVVTGSAPEALTSASASLTVSRPLGETPLAMSEQIATPRLREYFPETLVWQPQLETDKQGRAQLKFKLADNITTWKLAVIGSTIDGEIGIAEKEFRAFQPFFAELDPPRTLTEGDEIALPIVLRNYLNKAQTVNLEMKPEKWFTLLGPMRQRTEVAAGDAVRTVFDLRAIASVKDGKQRVTAIGTQASDAIEKTVSVHPDGEEITQTTSQIFSDASALEINVPAEAIKNSAHAELKIYPNLMTHVLEGIEGILQRPYGCGEQTISSTYPSLLVLRYLKSLSQESPSITAKAQRYLRAGYERLLGYRAQDGGFTYWGRGEADLALTAYALRFLNDAQGFITVDEDVIEEARDWLIKQQRADGTWPVSFSGTEAQRRTALNTAYIARVLAATGIKVSDDSKDHQASNDPAAALKRALQFLSRSIDEIDEPYLIACYALAAREAGQSAEADRAISKLRALARDEAGTNYWNLESNTPFYGWGLAGRIETTALVVKALALATENAEATESKEKMAGSLDKNSVRSVSSVAQRDPLLDRGLLFLLRNKDRYGVWLSTQATINVLDALVTLNEMGNAKASAAGQAEIIVNGRRATSVTMPPSNQLSNPITVDLTPFLITGSNRVEIKRAGNATAATAQLVESHYVPWPRAASAQTESFKPGASSGLRLAVSFDKTEAKMGEEVTCRVQAERVGFRGYGMMLAEIGLPPGADVDRASLERVMKESGWEINQYDILPDRLIVYLWPRAGGSRFEFKFRPRFGLKAQSASSALYDYYNPEARVVVAPTKFVVK